MNKTLKNKYTHTFEKIYEEHFAGLCLFSKRIVRRMDIAEDIVQEVILNVWGKKEELKTGDNLKSYLFTSVKNRSIDYLKRRIEKEDLGDYYVDLVTKNQKDFSENITDFELHTRIDTVINQMPDKTKRIFCMNRFEARNYSYIADSMQLSIKSIEYHISKALVFLKDKLKDYAETMMLIILVNLFMN